MIFAMYCILIRIACKKLVSTEGNGKGVAPSIKYANVSWACISYMHDTTYCSRYAKQLQDLQLPEVSLQMTYAVCPLNFRFSSSFIGVTSKSWTIGSSPPATSSWPSARKLPLYAFCRKWRNVFNVWTVRWSNTSTYSKKIGRNRKPLTHCNNKV